MEGLGGVSGSPDVSYVPAMSTRWDATRLTLLCSVKPSVLPGDISARSSSLPLLRWSAGQLSLDNMAQLVDDEALGSVPSMSVPLDQCRSQATGVVYCVFIND